jgi:hypothetical protein
MRSIKQRLLEVIEHTPDPLLEETLDFLIVRTQEALPLNEKFDPARDVMPQLIGHIKGSQMLKYNFSQ